MLLRRAGRALVVVLTAAVALVAWARPAAAHAELIGTEPTENAVVATTPPVVRLTFTEGVETALGAVRVLDAGGSALAVGEPRHPEGRKTEVEASLPALGEGSYVVVWRVTSADSHPIQGSFVFSVGQRSAVSADATSAAARSPSNDLLGALLGTARVVTFAGFVVVGGGLAMVVVLRRRAPRTAAVLLVGAAALALGSLVSLAVQGGYARGTSLGSALRPSVWRATAQTAFGRQALLRVAVASVGAALALVVASARRVWWHVAALAVAPLGALTIAYAGHAHTGRAPATGVVVDVVHLVAIAWWLGGLTLVVATALRAADGRDVVRRFSPLAFGSVVVVVASGVVQSWRQVGSRSALDTTFGRLLLAKVALVAVLLAAAALSRRALRRWTTDLRAPSLIRRSVISELALGVGVLGLTAGLVATPPARDQVARLFAASLVSPQGARAELTVEPARAGPVVVHVFITPPGGSLERAADARLNLALKVKGVLGVSVPLELAGPNHFASVGARIPLKGTWEATVLVRFGDFDSYSFTTTMVVQ